MQNVEHFLQVQSFINGDICLKKIKDVGFVAASSVVNEYLHDGKKSFIAWPPGLYIGEKKIGGILCEESITTDNMKSVLVGIGVYVNLKQDSIDAIDFDISSMSAICGKEFPHEEITVKIVNKFVELMQTYKENPAKFDADFTTLYKDWAERDAILFDLKKNKPVDCRILKINDKSSATIIDKETNEKYEISDSFFLKKT